MTRSAWLSSGLQKICVYHWKLKQFYGSIFQILLSRIIYLFWPMLYSLNDLLMETRNQQWEVYVLKYLSTENLRQQF